MYRYKPLITIDKTHSIDKQCQDIITNWEIVCEENDYHKEFVTATQWDQWLEKRKEVDSRIIELSTSNVGKIYDYLVTLNHQINTAARVDVKATYEDELRKKKKKEDANKLLAAQRSLEPSQGLLEKMMFWR